MPYFTGDIEQDCLEMFSYLEILPLFPSGNRMILNKGIRPISNVYGLTKWKRLGGAVGDYRTESNIKGFYNTKLKSLYPEFEDIFKEFTELYIPHFTYQQIVINKNFMIAPHKDGKNVGVSNIIALGDFTGGELMLKDNGFDRKCNIQNKFKEFNGSLIEHWVLPFEGTRYSLVFYNIL